MVEEAEKIVFRSDEASKGAFQGIVKIRGLQVGLTKQKSKFEKDQFGRPARDQLLLTLEDVAILEMEEGETEPELKDGKFTIYYNYAQPGKNPHKNSFYIKGFVASAEKMGKTPPDFNNTYVTLEQVDRVLFKRPKEDGSGDEEIKGRGFVYVPDEKVSSIDIKEYIKGKVIGKNKSAAMRELVLDNRAKQFPEYRDALNAGTLAETLGLVIDDKGNFVEKTNEAS